MWHFSKAKITLCTALTLMAACTKNEGTDPQFDDVDRLSIAESLIDAFYSFDPAILSAELASAESSKPAVMYYQGWAEGGNYVVLDRKPCVATETNTVGCSITVEDDPMLALGLDFKVTDTFEISFTNGKITSVETSSNDLPVYYEAFEWVSGNMPELIETPCEGYFDGGPTPADCAKAVVVGYALFAVSDDFPSGN